MNKDMMKLSKKQASMLIATIALSDGYVNVSGNSYAIRLQTSKKSPELHEMFRFLSKKIGG
jgi:hypothetical protein